MRNILRYMAVADKEVAQKATVIGIIDFILLFITVSLPAYFETTDLIWTIEVILYAVVILTAIYIGRIMYKSGKKNWGE